MIRIVQGVKYLHQNSLIHRDLKPLNIFVDHDFIPYLSDFDTVREIDVKSSSEDEKTQDIGALKYTSPEQYNGSDYSFSSDIYSLGLLIYFVFQKEDMFKIFDFETICDTIIKQNFPLMNKIPKYVESIITQCVKFNSNDRPSISSIENQIYEKIISFYFLEPSFLKKIINKIEKSETHQFFKEMYFSIFISRENNLEFLEKYQIQLFELLYLSNRSKIINFLSVIGDFYYEGKIIPKNYEKAKEHFELSSEYGNDVSQFYLGRMYHFGQGVAVDYDKAKEYYEKSAQKNNAKSQTSLGFLYYIGQSVEKDYHKAKEYFELASKQNNPVALCNLGLIYLNGYGVEKNEHKAIEYLEKAAEQNNLNAIKSLVI